MEDRTETPAWYAVHTRPQKEEYADLHLRRQGFTTFYPHTSEWIGLSRSSSEAVAQIKTRARLKKRPWLNRYLFVLAARPAFFRINETPGVARLVHVPGQAPLPVPDAVMQTLAARTDPYGEVLRPGPRWRRPRFHGRAGDRVRFAEGNPLFGFYGEIKRVLGAEILVELEAEILGRREARVPLAAIAEVLKG